jgi:hypothetical protein
MPKKSGYHRGKRRDKWRAVEANRPSTKATPITQEKVGASNSALAPAKAAPSRPASIPAVSAKASTSKEIIPDLRYVRSDVRRSVVIGGGLIIILIILAILLP